MIYAEVYQLKSCGIQYRIPKRRVRRTCDVRIYSTPTPSCPECIIVHFSPNEHYILSLQVSYYYILSFLDFSRYYVLIRYVPVIDILTHDLRPMIRGVLRSHHTYDVEISRTLSKCLGTKRQVCRSGQFLPRLNAFYLFLSSSSAISMSAPCRE